jgi:hypothetical protein
MKRHAALLPLAVFIAFSAAQTKASAPAPTLLGTKTPDFASQAQFLKRTSAAAAHAPSLLFTVNDEKGTVLTCIAPEIETNADTDVFKNCTLAPGRSLDDVMHIFVRGIHYEQSQHQKEREEWQKDLAEKKPAQK